MNIMKMMRKRFKTSLNGKVLQITVNFKMYIKLCTSKWN
jgi:hypothetical protein